MANYIKRFETISNYETYLKNTPFNEEHYTKDSCGSEEKGNKDWTGTESFDEANTLMVFGDKTNLERLTKSMIKLKQHKGVCSRQMIYSDVQGFMPNIQHYVIGLPNDMYSVKTKKYIGGTKIVNMVLNMGYDCRWKIEQIINCGVKILESIASLEAQGYRVNLYALNIAKQEKEYIAQAIRIKRSDDRLNMAKIAYPIANPSWTRRHFFKFIESAKVKKRFFGYGSAIHSFEDCKEILKDLNLKIDYYLDMYTIRDKGINLEKRTMV